LKRYVTESSEILTVRDRNCKRSIDVGLPDVFITR
jgi:hypothetical protein